MIARIPADGSDVFLSLFLVRETPDWQLVAFIFHRIKGFSIRPVVFVIVVLFFLVILHHHTFHDLQLFLEGSGVESGGLDLHDLLPFLSRGILGHKFLHASIENLPLVHFKRELNGHGGLGTDTFGSDGIVHSLTLSIIVVEFISERLFDHRNVVHHASWILGLLLSLGLVDHVLFNIIDFVLDGGFVSVLQNQIPFIVEMFL